MRKLSQSKGWSYAYGVLITVKSSIPENVIKVQHKPVITRMASLKAYISLFWYFEHKYAWINLRSYKLTLV